MKVIGLDLPENCTITFGVNSIKVGVTLNIPRELLPFMPREKVWKKKQLIYWVSQEIPLEHCSAKNISDLYYHLLNKAMRNVREKKQLMLSSQIMNLKLQQQKLDF